MLRFFRRSLICIAMALPLSALSESMPPMKFPIHPRVLFIRISMDKTTYHVRDAIRLRLAIMNRSPHELYVPLGPPYGMVKLDVLDASGRRLPSTGVEGMGGVVTQNSSIKLDPGKWVAVSYNDPDRHWAMASWVNIRHWGYDIRQPGTYTLVASPKIYAYGPGVSTFRSSGVDKSNKVDITLTR